MNHKAQLLSLAMLLLLAIALSCSRSNRPQASNSDSSKANSSPKSSSGVVDNYKPTAEEAAAVAAVQQKIASDQRIKSRDVVVNLRHSPATRDRAAWSDIELKGTVDNYDELFAVNADARSATNMRIAGAHGLDVNAVRQRDLWEVGWGAVPPSPPFVEPEHKSEIPICAGEIVVTAVAGSAGDYESIKTIESMDAKKVVLKYSAETKVGLSEVPSPKIELTTTRRNILFEDMESAHKYIQLFTNNGPEDATGTTSIGVSAAVLRELKSKGRSEVELCADVAGGGTIGSDGKSYFVIGVDKKPVFTPGGCRAFYKMTIYRTGETTEPFRVLLNGTSVELQAIHAKGTKEDHRDEFFFLNDEHNPLTLAFRFGIQSVPALTPRERVLCDNAKKNVPTDGMYWQGFAGADPPSCDLLDGGDRDSLRVVKINTDCRVTDKSAPSGMTDGTKVLEQSLAQSGKVDVYSIFFSFNSDVLREESGPTLKEIADVLKKHSDWKLRIAGHTDGIGGDQSNLDLSQRRAAAVKDALVKQFNVNGSRLTFTGFGKSQPVDTNETLEGRAHNRRVELSKSN